MPLTYTALRDQIESNLRDSANTYFATAELDYDLAQSFRDIASYAKHLVRITYELETRTGTATSTSSGNLVDATNDQFLSTDTGKRIHNTDDNTWADVISYSDAETVGLSQNIMASGENYEIYNKGCSNNKQINIEDVEDYEWVERVEFPVGCHINADFVTGNILQLGIDFTPDDTADADANKLVYVWFNKRHKVSQLTDFAGAVDFVGGYSKGATSMVIDGITTDEVIEEDQEFTLANRPQIYTVTAAVTIASSEATVSFYPGLDADVAEDVVVTFTQSTLNRKEEAMLIEYIVGLAQMNEANVHLPQISTGGTNTYKRYLEAASFRYNNALRQLQAHAEPSPYQILPRTKTARTIVGV
jgi:hypothetical protein